MYLAKARFKPKTGTSVSDLEDAVDAYVSSLMRNGQVAGHGWQWTWFHDVIDVYVNLSRPDSCDPKHNAERTDEYLAAVTALLERPIEWTLMDDDIPQRFPRLKSASFLYLAAPSLDSEDCSPVCRGNDDKAIPLYQIPVDQDTRQFIYSWAQTAEDHLSVWLDSGSLEIPAYRELCDPFSEHADWGRWLCKRIEEATGIQTYYYLLRYWGRKLGERERPCPVCGESWRVCAEQTKEFREFEHMCHPCRLVAHFAASDDDERHARIGEYREGRRERFSDE